jgi:PAS domain S-box-containing protein
VLAVNSYGAAELGYRPDELIGRPVLEVFHPEDRRAVEAGLGEALAQPGRAAKWRFRKIRKDATMLWGEDTVRAVEEDGRTIVLWVCEDVTARVEAEERIARYQAELRSLTSELTLAEERERRRIAEGLHDRIGQALVAARMQLAELREMDEDGRQRRSLAELRELLERILRQTRTLTFELSCPVLYRLGLTAALRDFGERLEKASGVRFVLAGELGPEPLAEDRKILLYRVVRELLWNVVKHARASTVRVALGRDGDGLRIAVEDDGVGFDATELRSGPTEAGGFGLFAIRERLYHLGGRLRIETTPAGGTRMVVVAPLAVD